MKKEDLKLPRKTHFITMRMNEMLHARIIETQKNLNLKNRSIAIEKLIREGLENRRKKGFAKFVSVYLVMTSIGIFGLQIGYLLL